MVSRKGATRNTMGKNLLIRYVFKERWQKEVQPERQHPDRELSNLRDSIPQAAKNKIVDCKTLAAACQVLDSEFGDEK